MLHSRVDVTGLRLKRVGSAMEVKIFLSGTVCSNLTVSRKMWVRDPSLNLILRIE